ncbi:unnamed protein product [Boreogadus saida]
MDRFGPSGPGARGPAVRMSGMPGDRAVKWQLCYDTAARTWWMTPDVWCIEEDRRLVPAAASETRRKTLPAVRKVMHVPLQCPAVGCHVSGDHCSANPPAPDGGTERVEAETQHRELLFWTRFKSAASSPSEEKDSQRKGKIRGRKTCWVDVSCLAVI